MMQRPGEDGQAVSALQRPAILMKVAFSGGHTPYRNGSVRWAIYHYPPYLQYPRYRTYGGLEEGLVALRAFEQSR